MTETGETIFSIGHSTHQFSTFMELLRRHGIGVIADVRSMPFSRMNPQYNRKDLEHNLKSHRIKYVFLGEELGARSDDPTCYIKGRVQYERLARTEVFQKGVQRVLLGSKSHRIALLCAEKEPLDCHRTLLVARALVDRGLPVQHILASGRLESHADAMERLLDITGLPREDLFRSKQELILEALARQEERVAYVNEKFAEQQAGSAP